MKKPAALLLLLMPVSLFSQNLDINLLRKVHSAEKLSSDGFFRFVSNSDTYVVTGIPITMAIIGLARNDDKLLRNACVTAVGTAVSFGITTGLKYIVNRDRPFVTYPEDIANKTEHNYTESVSFPSGHTTTAFATATALSLEYPKWYVIAPSFVYAGSMAYSRMHLGVHYPSDVIVGALVGSGCAYITHSINKKLNGRSNSIVK